MTKFAQNILKFIDKVFTMMRGHRTWMMATLIAYIFSKAIASLPPELLVTIIPQMPDLIYALAFLIGVGKVGDAILKKIPNKDKNGVVQ